MKSNHVISIGDAIERIADITETTIPEIINALTGVCFDEEDAGRLKEYHQEDEGL